MEYLKILEFLFQQLPMFHRIGKAAYKADLSKTLELDLYFGHPHRTYPTIHIAGTNGKGSVSHMLTSVLSSSGKKTGLFTSPHLKDFRERIKINGVAIDKEYITEFFNTHISFFQEAKPSFFEMTAALAFQYFADRQVDIAVIETGLGGRLDSTNIIQPILSVITNISFDHRDLLGLTLQEIAGEKAGIIKNNTPVVIGESSSETDDFFRSICVKKQAPVMFADQLFNFKPGIYLPEGKRMFNLISSPKPFPEHIALDLCGNYQAKNLSTLFGSLHQLNSIGIAPSTTEILSGLERAREYTGLTGRWQTLRTSPLVICDTGHNLAGISEIVAQIEETPHNHLHFVLGMVNDKDIDDILNILPVHARYYFTQAAIPRAMDAELLSEKAKVYNLQGVAIKSVEAALKLAIENAGANDLVFVGGSTFVVAEVV
jgi:dihydrofolate synthase/folylpolyglutamate synthase